MLYIDQPLGTGFSYVDLVNGTFDTLTQTFTPVKGEKVPETNGTFLQATFDSGELETVPKTTMSGARTMWAFAQVWFNEYVPPGELFDAWLIFLDAWERQLVLLCVQ